LLVYWGHVIGLLLLHKKWNKVLLKSFKNNNKQLRGGRETEMSERERTNNKRWMQ
jgi:hypothetical protein